MRTYYGPELAARLGHGIVATVAAARAGPAARDDAAVPGDAGSERAVQAGRAR
jgi:hypothetical protein